MSTSLNRQRQTEQELDVQLQYEPKYHEFTEIVPNQLELNDVIFFGQIASFAISTVLFCFILLVQEVSAFWSFSIALLISCGVVLAVSRLLNYLLND